MVVMMLQKTPAALKGELSRWLFEAAPGLYIGHVTAMVRDRLWEICASSKSAGSVFQAWSTNTEQHFAMRIVGSDRFRVVDYEGLQFMEEVGNALTDIQMKRMHRG
jgi:CRISPR-associated protein Cas2